MSRKTKTFSLSINRTILGKTRSHGSFVSCKRAWLDCFDMTEAEFMTKSKVFDRKGFFLREELYMGDRTHAYTFGLEKAGPEFRLSSLHRFFKDVDMTETDNLIIETIHDNGCTDYLVGKSVRANYIVLNKYKPQEYIKNGVEYLTRGNQVLNIVCEELSAALRDGTNCLVAKEAESEIREAQKSVRNLFREIDNLENYVDSATEQLGIRVLEAFRNHLWQGIDASANYVDKQKAKDAVAKKVDELIERSRSHVPINKALFEQPHTLPDYYWVWDNSIQIEMWEDLLNRQVTCMKRDEDGSLSKQKLLISEAGRVNIAVGDQGRERMQTKRLFKIDCLDEGIWKPLDSPELLGMERIGTELILTPRKVSAEYRKFECEIL